MRYHRTLNGVVACEGITLHSGEQVEVIIHPASEGAGIRFLRTDLDDSTLIHAHTRSVSDTFYATTISSCGISIGTVEHLMAALFSLGITNADIHVKGSELPILDGSSKDWVSLIQQVGVQVQMGAQVPELVITKPVAVKSRDRSATLYPYGGFAVDCAIDFDHPAIGFQRWEGEVTSENFSKELASARTFGMLRDVEYLRQRGRARGASSDNAIVLDDHSVVSPGGLRYKDEFVRHKVLDAIGDLSLLGIPIRGLLVSKRSGHGIHQQLLKVLLESPDCWEFSGHVQTESVKVHAQVRRALQLIS